MPDETKRKIGEDSVSAETQESAPEVKNSVSADADAGTPRKKMKTSKKVLIIVLVAAAAVAAYFALTYFDVFSTNAIASDSIVDQGVIYDGVSCLEIDLSGLTQEEAAQALKDTARKMTDDLAITVAVEEYTIRLNADDLAAKVDEQALAQAAYLYGREGDYAARKQAIDTAAETGFAVPCQVGYTKQTLKSALELKMTELDIGYKDAEFVTQKVSDEEKLFTQLTVSYEEGSSGIDIDYDDLDAQIAEFIAQSNGKDLTAEFTAKTVVTEPTITLEQLEQQYQKIGTYKTTYKSSAYGRKYNIWKMSDVINGVTIQPGETWSINEEAGPRTYARGWKGAPGISNGAYQEEAGGGICQVSSTLYNAVLRSEVTVVDRSHHSWPSDYVPKGLDATISTGSPDFKIRNDFDTPIVIAVDCNGVEGYVEVSIYRPAMEYKLDFTSEVVSESYSAADRVVEDPTLPVGTRIQELRAHPRIVANVYKQKYDLEGNPIGDKELVYTDTYSAFGAIVRVGTAPVEQPEETEPVAPAAPAPAEPAATETPAEPAA